MVWTHFVSVPLNIASQQDDFCELQQQVVQQFGDLVPQNAFMYPGKLHFTLCMVAAPDAISLSEVNLTLINSMPAVRDIAARAGCINASKELVVSLDSGLHTFPNNNPACTKVIFRKPVAESPAVAALHDMTECLIAALSADGIVCSNPGTLVLHMTVIQMRYTAQKAPIDATALLERYKDRPDATECAVPALHLSTLHGRTDPDAYYHCALRLPFDEDEVYLEGAPPNSDRGGSEWGRGRSRGRGRRKSRDRRRRKHRAN